MPEKIRARKGVAAVSSEKSSSPDQLTIKRILAPVDLSAASMQALTYAIPLAERFQADLHVVYVHENGHEFSAGSMSQLLYEIAKTRTRIESLAATGWAQFDSSGKLSRPHWTRIQESMRFREQTRRGSDRPRHTRPNRARANRSRQHGRAHRAIRALSRVSVTRQRKAGGRRPCVKSPIRAAKYSRSRGFLTVFDGRLKGRRAVCQGV